MEYRRIEERLAQPIARPLIFPHLEDTQCVRLKGPDPNWTPAWRSVYNKIDRMEPDVAYACALAARDTAWAMIGPRELAEESEEWELVQEALRLADISLATASNLQREYIEGSATNEYVWVEADEEVSPFWRRKAATAAILAYADAVATDKGFNPFDYALSYFPRVDGLDYVEIFVGPSRYLELYHDPNIHEEIQEGDDLWSIMEDWWSNGHGLGTVDELGAMSEAPFISEELTVEDDGTTVVNSPLWYYTNYMVRDPMDELREDGITSPWIPFYPGGEVFRSLGEPSDTWHGGKTLGHEQFFDVWWNLCRCRIPIYLLEPER